jgi:hypothetical protein
MARLQGWPKRTQLIIVLVSILFSFAYGVGVSSRHWPPYSVLKRAQELLDKPPAPYKPSQETLLQHAFSQPIIDRQQILAPLRSFQDLSEALHSLVLPYDQFHDSYENLEVLEAAVLSLDNETTTVLKVSYRLHGSDHDAYSYAPPMRDSRFAALVIPGSGMNQSSAIYYNDPSNYHFGISDALAEEFDQYTLIKPNEDCLAFHNGQEKLSRDFIINWLLNRGGSYSANYIIGALAITKHLQARYERVVTAGLSQGGHAVLLASLQSIPDAAIISSGFSIIKATLSYSPHDRIIIPNLRNRVTFDDIRMKTKQSRTRYLFTYGRKEHGAYGLEAETRASEEFFGAFPNGVWAVHDQGHVFPKEIIASFLRELTHKWQPQGNDEAR